MEEELKRRVNMLIKAKSNKLLQEIEVASCEKSILYFFQNYLYTDKNSTLFNNNEPSVLPFIPFPFQEEAITEIRSSIMNGTLPLEDRTDLTNVFIEKSRQMGLSRLIMGIFVYGYVFFDHKYLVISQKEEDVDKIGNMKSLFEKARFMLNNLPDRMLPAGYTRATGSEYNKYKSISRSDGTGSITGESANPNASRGGTYNAIFDDEFAFVENAATINTAQASATPCIIYVSTPNGEGNEFYRMRKLTMSRRDENGVVLPPEIKGLRYHRTEHPLYDQTRYDWKVKGKTKEWIAQELDINYNVALEGRVYTEYKGETRQLAYIPTKPLYVSVDNSHGGSDPHAVLIAQTDPTNHFIDIIDCIEINCSIPDMANYLGGAPKMNMSKGEQDFFDRYTGYNRRRATFVGDPYDSNTTIRNIHNIQGIVISDEYKKLGIYINTPERIEVKTRIMNTRANMYRVRIHERCAGLISAIQNARYPRVGETSSRTTANDKPIHDWTSHYRTAFEYLMAWILENEVKPKNRVPLDTRAKRDYVTGKLYT